MESWGFRKVVSRELRLNSVSQSPLFPWWTLQVAPQRCGHHTVIISNLWLLGTAIGHIPKSISRSRG